MNSQYFAAADQDKVVGELLSKADSWYNNMLSNGLLDKLRSMWLAYHGAFYTGVSTGHQVSFGGEQGELVQLPINHFRNIASHIITITTSNRPSMEARAVNSDYKSKVQTILANGILDYYMREKRLETYLKNAVEYAVVLGAGYVKMEWNATAGEIYDYFDDETTGQPDMNRPIYEGDIEFSNLSPFDVLFDTTKEDQNHDWILVRTFKNKYDLAVKYPEFADKITSLRTKDELEKYSIGINTLLDKTDDVPVFEFYHKKTDSMPNGRYMLFCDTDIVLQDIGIPYRMIPIFRISSGEILGTPYGYSPMYDILPIQEAVNSLYSTILTNQNATGVQNFWIKPGSNITSYELSGGMNLIESMDKPEVLNLCSTPKEVFDFIKMLEQTAETLSGVNSVARGNPESSLRSGSALALVQSMALQFLSGLQQSYVALIENVGSGIIKVLQDYASVPRMAAIAGKSSRTQLKQFTNGDIANITRVYVDVGNPLARTIAGRMQLAEQLLQYKGDEVNPAQIIEVMNTGRLDSMTDDTQSQLLLIDRENEDLLDGETPPVMITDSHQEHIMEHRKVLNDPDLRKDSGLVERVTAHLNMHIQQLQTGNPQLLQLMGQQPLPPPQQQGQQPQGQQGPQAPGPQGPQQGAPQGQPGPGQPHPPTQQVQAAPPQGQVGIAQQGNQVHGPGLPPNGVHEPQPAKVPAQLLPSPQLQQQSLHNVKGMK